MTAVIFKREHKDGLEFSAIYVADHLLQFFDDIAQRDLEAGSEHDIYWRIMGPTGATLTVTKSVSGTTEKIVESPIRPSDKGRRRDFTLFKV